MGDNLVTIRFSRENLEIRVPKGTTVLQAAKALHAPQGDRCGGVCACSTCHVYVREGFSNCSEIEDEEFDILDKARLVTAQSRLGCQAKVMGDIVVEISDESFQAFCDEHPDEKAKALLLRAARE